MAAVQAGGADPSNLLDNDNDLEAGVIGMHQTDDITAMAQTLLMQPVPDDNQVGSAAFSRANAVMLASGASGGRHRRNPECDRVSKRPTSRNSQAHGWCYTPIWFHLRC